MLLGTYASEEAVAAVTHELGLDKPLVVRFGYWLKEVVQGDLGQSTLSHQPVTSLLGNALSVTLELSLAALLLALLVAVPTGLWLGARADRWWSRPAMLLVNLGVSIPGFWVGLMLIVVFAVELRLLPAGGWVSFADDPVGNVKAMILPTVTLAFWLAPPLARFTRATTIGVLREDYVATARAKGVGTARLLSRHVAPNAAIPTITYLGLQLGTLIGGATVTEVIFTLPGMGRLALTSILDRDYPVVQAVVLTLAAGYIVVNVLVDLVYAVVDPRVRVG